MMNFYGIFTISSLALFFVISCVKTHENAECAILKTNPEQLAKCLQRHWSGRISDNPRVQNFLKKYKIYVSYTTSPKRLDDSLFVLLGAQPFLDHVEAVFLAIPSKFGRTGASYSLESPVYAFPKVERVPLIKDFGPISKMLPVVKMLHERGVKDGIVITLDDDIGYAPDLLARVVETAILKGGAASSQVNCLSAYGSLNKIWPTLGECEGSQSTDIVEGWGAVAYRLNIFSDALIQELEANSAASKECYLSDDVVISYSLAKRGIPRWHALSELSVIPFAEGETGSDALHNGANGLSEVGGLGGNSLKYNQCINFLRQYK
ncbi:MAG: hypothetical protein V4534_04675 [Myxococcota bacterium]